jgi:hypothetical protein
MKLDHIAVTQPGGRGGPEGHYQIRAELKDDPPGAWRMQFQVSWYNSPACRRLCSDVQMDGKSIFIHINNARQVTETVAALKMIMADLDESPHGKIHPQKKAIV